MQRIRGTGMRKLAKLKGVMALALTASTLAPERQADHFQGQPPRQVMVSLSDRKLAVVEGRHVIRVFPVAVGAAVSPSPTGKFRIVSRLANPTYYHEGLVIPPGTQNPVGPRWVGLSKKGYGIHGTNEPQSIGKAASHGCIRMRNVDVEQFYSLVKVGDPVEIRGEHDDQTARMFAEEMNSPALQAQVSQGTLPLSGQ
jgi:lipoprotein-anchoring transpeptidase ErfK/SrfK